jgi:hypothetical protein
VIPKENMSARTVTSFGRTACSGDIYFIVPKPCCFVTVRVPEAAEARKSPHFVTPKSPSFTNEGTLPTVVADKREQNWHGDLLYRPKFRLR